MKILTPAEIEKKRIREGVEQIQRYFTTYVSSKEGARILLDDINYKYLEEGVKNAIPLFKKSGWDVSIIMERLESRNIKEEKFLGIIQTKEVIPTEIKKYYLVFEPIKKEKSIKPSSRASQTLGDREYKKKGKKNGNKKH